MRSRHKQKSLYPCFKVLTLNEILSKFHRSINRSQIIFLKVTLTLLYLFTMGQSEFCAPTRSACSTTDKLKNYAIKLPPNHRVPQIWLPATISSFRGSKCSSLEKDFTEIRSSR